MNTYYCRFEAREKNAIGVFSIFEKTVEAIDAKAARLKLYDTHEHIHNYLIVNREDPTDNITHKQIKV